MASHDASSTRSVHGRAARSGRALAMLICVLASASCASYTEEIRSTQSPVIAGDSQAAIEIINQKMGVAESSELPEDLDENNLLLLLERATLLQAQGYYDLASRDMSVADNHLILLDVDGTDAKDVARYLYSDDVADYRAPVYERLLLNTLNMINFLAVYDLEGARVEARRFRLMERYFIDTDGRALLPDLIAFGNYIAAATFEASSDYENAARHYTRAWHFGLRDESMRDRLRDLYRITSYRGDDLDSPIVDRLRQEAKGSPPMSWSEYAERHQQGDTLVIAQYGIAPYKQAVRLGAGQAVTLSAAGRRRNNLSSAQRAQVASLSATGALTHVNFPLLTHDGLPGRDAASARLSIDGRANSLALAMDVERAVELAWAEIAGPLIGAAITRAITRATVGQVGRAAGGAASQSDNSTVAAVGILGWIASLGTEAALNVADTPDTRSWTTLPGYIVISRTQLPQGLHTAQVNIGARLDRQAFPVWSDRFNVVNFSRIR